MPMARRVGASRRSALAIARGLSGQSRRLRSFSSVYLLLDKTVSNSDAVPSQSPWVATNWTIAGLGDFSGDGRADVLWRNQVTGLAYIWFMDGTQNVGGGPVAFAGLDWAIVGAADFDGG